MELKYWKVRSSFPELKAQGWEDAPILHVPMRPQGPRGQGHAALRRFVKFLGNLPAPKPRAQQPQQCLRFPSNTRTTFAIWCNLNYPRRGPEAGEVQIFELIQLHQAICLGRWLEVSLFFGVGCGGHLRTLDIFGYLWISSNLKKDRLWFQNRTAGSQNTPMGQNRKSQSPKLDATYPKISGATYPKISDWKPSFVGLSKYAIFGRYPLPQTHLKGFSEKKTCRNDFKVPIPGLLGKGQSIQMGYLKNWKPIPSPLGTNSVHREFRYGPAILGGLPPTLLRQTLVCVKVVNPWIESGWYIGYNKKTKVLRLKNSELYPDGVAWKLEYPR